MAAETKVSGKISLGVDIGGTKTAVCLGDRAGNLLNKIKVPTTGPEETVEEIIRAGKTLLAGAKPLAVGISCGSPQDSARGIIQAPPNLPLWVDVPITELLQKAFDAPAFLANDANACALAEWKFGAGRGTKNMIFLTFGTGLGAGLILGGRLYEGTCGMAGEAGHMGLTPDGPEGYGKAGSFEGFCSGGGISRLGSLMGCEGTAKELAQRAKAGDAEAMRVYRASARKLGLGLSILIDLFNPERIVIGSVFARSEALFREEMEGVIAREALAEAAAVCAVVPAELGDAIGDYAAVAVAKRGMEE